MLLIFCSVIGSLALLLLFACLCDKVEERKQRNRGESGRNRSSREWQEGGLTPQPLQVPEMDGFYPAPAGPQQILLTDDTVRVEIPPEHPPEIAPPPKAETPPPTYEEAAGTQV